ncbi:MAG: VWA domain-containing protein [Candidatus Aminicenantes bacterium]|nr:VWA domain-containing protein [Candidatus Aminicenantes bacterium]
MKRNIVLVFFILSISFCFLYAFQKQQELQEPLEHEVTVELVIVEVFVTDKKRNFVHNLTREDFEIYEDGKKVEIQYFAVVKPEKKIEKEEAMEVIEEREEPRRPEEMKLVILFDNINTHRWYLYSQWPQIQEMFQTLSGNVEETMIMELNRRSGARMIQPFTSDQNLLSDVFSKFKVDMWKDFEKEVLKDQREELLKQAHDFSPEFALLKDEEASLNLPAVKIESFFDGKSKILNEVYLLDFQDIIPGDYKLEIKPSAENIKKEIELKIVS